MKTVTYYFKVAAIFTRLSIQRQLEYPLFLVTWLLMIPIQYFSGIWMLKIITERLQPLNGWDFPELTFLYGLGLLSHGIFVVFFITTWSMDYYVIQGEYDRLLLRPLNVFFQLIASHFNFIGLIDLIPGIIIFLYGASLVGFDWSFLNIIKLILILIGGVLIRTAVFVSLGTIAFWTKRNSSLVGFTLTMLERTTMYPLSIYPYVIQVIFTFILPFGFISFYPLSELLSKHNVLQLPWGISIWSPIVGVVCFLLASMFFRNGLKKYESAGS